MQVFLMFCLILTLAFVLLKGLVWLTSYRSPQFIGKAITHINTDKKLIALTFDDGPFPPYTDSILRILREQEIHASFFVIGKNAWLHPDLIKQIYREGHEIGNHSWSHKSLVWKSPYYIREEIEKTDSILRKLGYKKEIAFRAPFGEKFIVLPWVLSKMHKKHILFDVLANDWESPGVEAIVNKVMSQVKPGSIIILHDGDSERKQTVEALAIIIPKLKDLGYRFVTISELINESIL